MANSPMFKTAITSSPLCGGMADECFGRINASQFRGDVALASVARVLFDKRLEPSERININLTPMYYGSGFNTSSIKEAAAELHAGDLQVFSISVRSEDSGKWMPDIKDVIAKQGLYELEGLEKWFASFKTNVLIFTDQPYDPKIPRSPTNNSKSIVVIETLTMQKWHLIGSLIPRMLGVWFEKTPRTAEETAMLNALIGSSPEALSAFFDAYAKTYDFRGMAIRSKLADFEVKFAKLRYQALEEKCANYDRQIKEASRKIGDLLKQREDSLAMLFGYQTQADKDIEPLTMNYFLTNKNLYLREANQDYLDFYDVAWLSNWDPDKADVTFAKNHCSSWLESNQKFGFSDDDAKLLYKAIFLDETVKVRLWSHIRLHLRGEDPMSIIGHETCISDIQNALPNPHHQYNSCGGGNRAYVGQCIIDRDIVGAVEQCISATAGINLTEHASYQYFANDLFDPKFGKVVYINETGEFVTAKNAVKWLKEKQDGKTAEAEAQAKEVK